jgi:hypothetical protein
MGVGDMRRFAVGSLSDILDMALVSPSVGDVLLFQSGQWQNKSLADAGISAVGHNHDNVYVAKTTFDPNTILAANIDNTPVAVSVAEQRLVGRVTAGSIAALTAGEVRTLLNVEDGATADMTANEILTALIGVDGSGSLLDGDLLDGQHGSYYSDIPARLGYTPVNKAGDTITGGLKVTGTVAATDRLAVGGESFWTGRGVVVQGSTVCSGTGGPTIGYLSNVTVGNDVTGSHYQYYSFPSVASGANTLQYLVHFAATANTFGQTVTYQYGFHAAQSLTEATNNYGFYGGIPSGTGRYNCYMGGTAYNYFSGNTGIGVQPDGNNKLAISGAIAITGTPTITGTTDYAHLYTADITAGNRAVHTRTENGSVIKFYQQALIASPSADVSSLKTAVDAIRTLLINNGLMASS